MTSNRSIVWFNSLFIILVIFIIICVKLINTSAVDLFLPPPSPKFPFAGLLTHAFQILCCIPPFICAFSFGLLKKIKPVSKNNSFILYSALITGGFLLNEIYRIHIIILQIGVPKLITVMFYAIPAISYGLAFRRRILSTPYIVLITGLILLFTTITVDSLGLSGNEIPSLLEGIPKLFSGLNVAFYYWLVCYKEVTNSFKNFDY